MRLRLAYAYICSHIWLLEQVRSGVLRCPAAPSAALHTEARQSSCEASDPSSCGAAAKTAEAARLQGPIGAAQTYTVSGVLRFSGGDTGPAGNMFDVSGGGASTGSATGQGSPSGTWGNEISPDGITIDGLGKVEFAAGFYLSGASAPSYVDVSVDLTPEGQIDVTRYLVNSNMPLATLVGTMTLASDLFKDANNITNLGITPLRAASGRTSAQAMRDGSKGQPLVLEDIADQAHTDEQGGPSAALGQLLSDLASPQAVPPPASALQTWGALTAVANRNLGLVTITIPAGSWSTVQSGAKQSFQVGFGPPPSPCAAGGLCCDSNGNPTRGNVCRQAPRHSCVADAVCDGVNADCPASPPKRHGTPCPWSPSHSHIMGGESVANDAKAMSVPAYEAAAWVSGVPAYDTEWPECEGKCMEGRCALRWDHPACCLVHPHGSRGYDGGHVRPYENAAAADQEVSPSSFGYWRSRDWYCWK